MNIFERLENLAVSEECFEEILDLVEGCAAPAFAKENGNEGRTKTLDQYLADVRKYRAAKQGIQRAREQQNKENV